MADCMNFPDDPMEFIKGYSFKDEEQIYTNGAELISVLRVQQMIEHYFSDKNGWISVKEVANIIADLFGDNCACNNNGIDEWLPKYCEYRDTDCPYPTGASCWEQYLKHLDKKPKEENPDA